MSNLEIRGDVYAEDIKKSLNELGRLTNKTAAQIIQDRAPMMARYLAEWTMPVAGMSKGDVGATVDGGGQSAKKLQENAISRDIRRAYMSPAKVINALASVADGESLKKAFTKASRTGDLNEATRIVRLIPSMKGLEVMIWDKGRLHESKRMKSYNGRVHRGTRPIIVTRSGELKKYIKERQNAAGFTKAAWINAGKHISLKTGRVSAWITRHVATPSIGTFKSDGVKSEARLTNNVPWVSKKIDDRRAMEAFDRSMKQSITKAIDYIAKREARKAQRTN
jgi:hypothetical protein